MDAGLKKAITEISNYNLDELVRESKEFDKKHKI